MANLKKRKKMFPRYVIIFVIIGIGIISATGIYIAATRPAVPSEPLSRQVMDYQQTIVRAVKPPPTTAALQYAYVSSAYADGIHSGSQRTALQAAQAMLEMIYPEKKAEISAHIVKLAADNNLQEFIVPDTRATELAQGYASRYAGDGHSLVWDLSIPKGPGKWIQTTPKDPMTPRAGEWQRWNVQTAIDVPPPPVLNSSEDRKQIAGVSAAAASRNGQDVNTINFWGGTPGTETPSGIWQNQLYATIRTELPKNHITADQKYALVQKVLAQTESDAFMECWKVKYTYWTARPSMRIPGLVTAMDNPNFPSYISGHSTISKAAADVLGVLTPQHKAAWNSMAMEARQSRLKAGIHFDIDNAVGYDVGSAVASQTIAKLGLKAQI